MKIADQMTAELKTLQIDDLLLVHQLILSLKARQVQGSLQRSLAESRRVRLALHECRGSWSEDVLAGREDRI